MKTTLDNLIYYVEAVTAFQWDNFMLQLEIAETYGKVPRVSHEIGKAFSKYHHNVRIGEGAGAIHIGYKHNSAAENLNSYRLRFETNPSKEFQPQMMEARKNAVDIFITSFRTNTKLLKGIDLAFDVPIAKDKIMVISKTGRQRQIVKGTIYYGERSQHGNLKVYDKKKELKKKQGIEIEEDFLTRIEYSLRLEDPLTFQLFSKIGNINMNQLYQISHLDIEGSDGIVKACLLAVQSGQMQMNEFTRTYQRKIKKALEDTGLLDLDHAYSNAQAEIVNKIRQFITTSNDSTMIAI